MVTIGFLLYGKIGIWLSAFIISIVIQGFIAWISYEIKEDLFLSEIKSFRVAKEQAKVYKANGVLFVVIFFVIVVAFGICLCCDGKRRGQEAAESMRKAQLIEYNSEQYMIVASNDSHIAVEAANEITDSDGKRHLEVDPKKCLLLDPDETKEISVKDYDNIKKND